MASTPGTRYVWLGAGRTLRTRVDGPAEGGAGPVLACCNGLGVSTFYWDPQVEFLRHERSVLTWDYRGHGLSSEPSDPGEMTIERCADDLERVLAARGIEEVVTLGHSMGVQVILEHLRRHPGRVRGLVPVLGTYGRPLDTFFDAPLRSHASFAVARLLGRWTPGLVEALNRWITPTWPVWLMVRRLRLVQPELCPRERMEPYFEHLSRIDPEMILALAESMKRHDASDLLEDIDVPVLVVAGEHDVFTPLRLSREMHRRIPDAELLVIPRGSHAALIEQPELIALRLEKFLRQRVER